MSFDTTPTLTPNEKAGALLMAMAVFAGLLLFLAWYDAEMERGARAVTHTHQRSQK